MAHLVRPWIVSYIDRDGSRVPAGTRGARKRRRRASKWYGQGVPGHPPKKRIPLASNKRVAQQMLAELVDRGERGIRGLPDRKEASLELAGLVDEFEQAVGRKATPKHTRIVAGHVRQVLAACKLTTLADIRAADVGTKVESFVWGLTKGEAALTSATAAYIGKHARSFTRWLWRKRKLLDHDPLAGVDLPSQESTTKRRALTAPELAALIDAAGTSQDTFRGLAGPDRAVLYTVAVSTGYRLNELAQLTPASFDLDAEMPTVRLGRKQTKNRKESAQPIPPAVANRLRKYLTGRPAARPVWPGSWPDRAADMLRSDLVAAGVPLVVENEAALFHSLRHTFTTLLARIAPVKVTQELSRHSTPTLTIGRYAHAGMQEKADAVALLPLPGAEAPAGPFAGMTRPQLETAAEAQLAVLAAIGWTVFAPRVAPHSDSTGDSRGRRGTNKGWKPAARGK